MSRFEVDLYNLFNERQDEAYNLKKQDPKYQEILKKHQEVMQEIESLSSRELLIKFDSVDAELKAIEGDYLYRQGFSDGIKFNKLLEGLIPESASACYRD